MREKYVTPDISEESTFEVQARACNKVPGLSATNFCGQVWIGRVGHPSNPRPGCDLNYMAKSS